MNRFCAILFLLFLGFTQLMAQADCVEFESYSLSQDWVRQQNQSEENERKAAIIRRFYCERQLGEDRVKYKLILIFEGRLIEGFPESRDYLLEQASASNFRLTHSICESNVYPQRCNLGFVIIDGIPIANSFDKLDVINVKRKGKIILVKIKSKEKINVLLRVESFDSESTVSCDSYSLKKGLNSIRLSTDSYLKLISFSNGNNKLVIVK